MADKGKAPAINPSSSSPPKNDNSPISRERSRSPPATRPQQPDTSGPSNMVSRRHPAPYKCTLCTAAFTTPIGLENHAVVHSSPPKNNSAEEAWNLIMQRHRGNPPAPLVDLYQPQLEHERSQRNQQPVDSEGWNIVIALPAAIPDLNVPAKEEDEDDGK